jgi:G:T/U-mismatch repair DNA glycosylase
MQCAHGNIEKKDSERKKIWARIPEIAASDRYRIHKTPAIWQSWTNNTKGQRVQRTFDEDWAFLSPWIPSSIGHDRQRSRERLEHPVSLK